MQFSGAGTRRRKKQAQEEKRKLANDEIDSSGSLEDTKKQVRILVDQLKQMAGSHPH